MILYSVHYSDHCRFHNINLLLFATSSFSVDIAACDSYSAVSRHDITCVVFQNEILDRDLFFCSTLLSYEARGEKNIF